MPDAEHAWRYGVKTPLAEKLAAAFWPGPLTLVLAYRADADIADLALAGLSTIAIRVPSHPVALALLGAVDRPLAAPSANKSGRVSPTSAAHVTADFGDTLPLILDGGATTVGIESAIVDASGATLVLLRPGGITRAAIEGATGARFVERTSEAVGDRPAAPGQLASHYATRAQLRLNVTDVRPGEALLAFGPLPVPLAPVTFNLSPTGDLVEAASHLFGALRWLDAQGAGVIAVQPIPQDGLGEAINDRIARAAAPRN